MGVPNDTYGRGSVSGNMLIIRSTTASTSQTNPRENGNFGVKKILEAKAVCRLCSQRILPEAISICDAINICECNYPLLHLECEENWSPESPKCRFCKKEYRKIYVTVEPEQIPEERQNQSWFSFSALKRLISCASSPRVMD